MASRSDDIKAMSSLLGNAAAHRAIYGANAFTLHEATVYEGQAEKIAEARNWNEGETNRLIERTKREARNIIKNRKQDWRDKSYGELCFLADRAIDKYMKKVREGKPKPNMNTRKR